MALSSKLKMKLVKSAFKLRVLGYLLHDETMIYLSRCGSSMLRYHFPDGLTAILSVGSDAASDPDRRGDCMIRIAF